MGRLSPVACLGVVGLYDLTRRRPRHDGLHGLQELCSAGRLAVVLEGLVGGMARVYCFVSLPSLWMHQTCKSRVNLKLIDRIVYPAPNKPHEISGGGVAMCRANGLGDITHPKDYHDLLALIRQLGIAPNNSN